MLEKLKIINLAIIDSFEIEFSNSFNVLTGESGSGKTVLYKSITYLFGQRFKKEDLRKGENKCIISGEIRVGESNYSIKRIFTKNSTKNFINNEAIKLSEYSNFLAKLWESYGQHEQQLLIDETNHLGYLDLFSKTETLYQEYLVEYEHYLKIDNEIKILQKELDDFIDNKELYEFQYKELNHIDIKNDEDIELKESISEIKKNKDVYETIYKLSNLNELQSDTFVTINSSIDLLNELDSDKSGSNNLKIRLNEYINELNDIKFEASKLLQEFYYNQAEYDEMNKRLVRINELKRKYGGTIPSLISYRNKLKLLIENSDNADSLIEQKIKNKNKIKIKLNDLGSQLYEKRKHGSLNLISKIKDFLAAMGMPDIDFVVSLGLFEMNKFALEKCCFYITTNKGEDLKSLGRVASGGELSRIMMAIKLSINLNTKNKLYLLDEIDAGLSGKEADSIGAIIKSLSLNNQVVCITHLPQIASKTNNHYKLFKEVINGRTYCKYLKLDKTSRVNELAKMVSGKEITLESIDFAKGILDKNG